MKSTRRTVALLALSGILATGLLGSGSATPWFGKPAPRKEVTRPDSSVPDLKKATVTYIAGLCRLPVEQRDSSLHELNEELLPNHVTVGCGPASEE